MHWERQIFQNHSTVSFEKLALEIFQFQASSNPVYRNYLKYIKVDPKNVQQLDDIPYIPIELFKSHEVICEPNTREQVYTSSGTGGVQSQHIVHDVSIYEESFFKGFEHFYGAAQDYTILALLPSYLERSGSSLIYMCEKLIQASEKEESGFYLNEHEKLYSQLQSLEKKGQKTLLIGVSFGLLDFVEKYTLPLKHAIVMETGGMKGRRKEMIREELHQAIGAGLNQENIHSEYGMTELLSQAYSKGAGRFSCPPWMKVTCRDVNDPFSKSKNRGGLNIIDLANVYSCAFIASQDLGKIHTDGTFEVLGRFDYSDVRGCNLMVG
ncbi:MAG: acyl transferase [Flavobacteriales bacterium]|nr:acyl transferase [Flavobacteriales bacterium]